MFLNLILSLNFVPFPTLSLLMKIRVVRQFYLINLLILIMLIIYLVRVIIIPNCIKCVWKDVFTAYHKLLLQAFHGIGWRLVNYRFQLLLHKKSLVAISGEWRGYSENDPRLPIHRFSPQLTVKFLVKKEIKF